MVAAIPPPWRRPKGLAAVVSHWEKSAIVKPCVVADRIAHEAEGTYAPFPPGLAPELAAALRGRGVDALYSHQARAFDAANIANNGVHGADDGGGAPRRGLVVATPTASGKSYCFHLPVLDALIRDDDARAIYMFPTKALARDQEAGMRELMRDAGLKTPAVVYDGDTPADARRSAREMSRVLITNPDMLHTGILPHHTAWAKTFQNLKYVVLDELHTYKGVFGSHVANVIRRLLRIAEFHGSWPILISATATIGNPRAHAARIFGMQEDRVVCIGESGAPRGERRVFLYNPPVVNAELGIRASYVKQAVMLAADLVRAEVPTIVFGHSRNNVEVMLRYLRDKVAGEIGADRIQGYRGGYLPERRRQIEQKLRTGEILCVVATNALELGIDIGDLDAVVCAGYPGSVAATWQRFGRAGRRAEQSIAVLVTSSAPLDQYLAREPSYLFGAPVEEARIDPDNVEILLQHLKCAAFELPFRKSESFGLLGPEETGEALGFLTHHKVLHEAGGAYHWATDAYPANNVSLRSVGWDNVVIIAQHGDGNPDKVLAEIDFRGAHTMVHEQAIYQHDGECYQVEKFDYENHKAFVRKVVPDYFTDAMTYTQISVLEEDAVGEINGHAMKAASGWGEVSVVEKVVGYKKIKFYTHENTGYGEVHLPEMQMHTTAFWLTLPEERMKTLPGGKATGVDALYGIGIALETVSTFALMCDPRDLGTALGDVEPNDGQDPPRSTTAGEAETDTSFGRTKSPGAGGRVPMKMQGGPRPGYDPTLFLYEHIPGGTGLAERIFALRDELLPRAHHHITSCPCDSGCPACVGPANVAYGLHDPRHTRHTRKSVALQLLSELVSAAVSAAGTK